MIHKMHILKDLAQDYALTFPFTELCVRFIEIRKRQWDFHFHSHLFIGVLSL